MEFTSKETIDNLIIRTAKVIFDSKTSGEIDEALAIELVKHIKRAFSWHIKENRIDYESPEQETPVRKVRQIMN